MSESGILNEALKINKCSKQKATHFALCRGDHIRYLLELHDGKRRLSGNLASYSGKLGMLMKLLPYLPFSVLELSGLGYFASVKLHPEIKCMADGKTWNVIVGTYDEKQKLVIQTYSGKGPAQYIKVGNKATDTEMRLEIEFLQRRNQYKNFTVPQIREAALRDDKHKFNIMVTEEFTGARVEPVLTEDIIRIYQEISSEKMMIDGVECEFSHGDFTPWNIKKPDKNNGFTVFDWEHCGYRIKGYDLAHYATIIEVALNGKSFDEGFEIGLGKIKALVPEYSINKKEFMGEFRKTVKELAGE